MSTTPTSPVETDVASWAAAASAWLATVAEPAGGPSSAHCENGSEDVSVFHDLSFEEEQRLLDRAMAWQRAKFDAGYGAITWPTDLGGAGLTGAHERAFREAEAAFSTPEGHETFAVTVGLIAPTIRVFGTDAQKERFLRRFLRTEELCCQLFSEPGAGSDLASLATSARRDGDQWVVNGQKVWTSGAQYSSWGLLVARTDPTVPKHAGMTGFILPMDSPGVEVRPIRQMSGGSSFNEVWLTDVEVSDDLRLGPVGQGWRVALTTLGFERAGTGSGRRVGGDWRQLLELARRLGRTGDPVVRQWLVEVYIRHRLRSFTSMRVSASRRSGQAPGPEGSIGKLAWSAELRRIGEVASALLGPAITADTEQWGTFAWSAHLLGAPGYASLVAPTKSNGTSLENGSLACPASPGWIGTSPGETSHADRAPGRHRHQPHSHKEPISP